LMTRKAAYHYQEEYGDVDAQYVEHDAREHNGADDDAENAEIETFDFRFFGLFLQGRKGDPGSKNGKADPQPEWEVAGAHACGRTHGVARCTQRETDAQCHEHDSGPEVLLISKLHVDEPLLQIDIVTPWPGRQSSAAWVWPDQKVPNGNGARKV